MPDLGQRSVQMNVTNATSANLTVQAVSVGSDCTWLQGSTPKQGDTLSEYSSAQWGVTTDDYNSVASGSVSLTGLGAGMITIAISNDNTGTSACTPTGNAAVVATPVQMPTNDDNHSLFTVTLAHQPASAKA